MNKQQQINAALLEIKQQYTERLPGDLAKLQQLAEKLTKQSDESLLSELHYGLHKISGSAGSFGLKRLGSRARELEIQVKRWCEQKNMPQQSNQLADFVAAVFALSELATEIENNPEELEVNSQTTDSAVEQNQHKNKVLWLVEDDDLYARDLLLLLEQYGYHVRLFNRYDQAEQAVSQEIPDLLLIDVFFQEEALDSTEALNGSQLHASGCPIIFITAYSDFYSRMRAVRLNAFGFLNKPLDLPKLVERLEQVFEQNLELPFRILIIDDDIALAEHYALILKASDMEVKVIYNPVEVVEAVAEFRPELILMDIYMPDYSGIELAMLIRQYDEWIGLPIIYLSSENDMDQQLLALESGADDFLNKPISDKHLLASVKLRAARSRQISQLISRDSLTGLLKHSCIKEELDVELSRAQRIGKPLCVIMCDIDHFKRVNDSHGHAIGDRVIKGIAHLLKQCLRKVDIIGRYGGEEFAIVLPDCEAKAAMKIMENIRQRFEKIPFNSGKQNFHVTLSAGIACLEDCEQAKQILVAADDALYQAKNSGRNQVRLYNKKV